MKKWTILSVLFLVLCSCFKKDNKEASANPADCDEDKAKKTIEEIKTNEFSLLKKADAGCTLDATPTIAIPTATPQ